MTPQEFQAALSAHQAQLVADYRSMFETALREEATASEGQLDGSDYVVVPAVAAMLPEGPVHGWWISYIGTFLPYTDDAGVEEFIRIVTAGKLPDEREERLVQERLLSTFIGHAALFENDVNKLLAVKKPPDILSFKTRVLTAGGEERKGVLTHIGSGVATFLDKLRSANQEAKELLLAAAFASSHPKPNA